MIDPAHLRKARGIAYVFWHWPTAGTDPARYAEALVAFHHVLASAPPAGFRGSRVLEVEGAPWLPVARAFEDWYFLDDFAALGALNEAAVAGARREPHDAAARLAAGGHGAIYRLLTPAPGPLSGVATWCSKPPGVPYPRFLETLPAAETWQRQLVLGPAPEFCLVGLDAAAPLDGVAVRARQLHASPPVRPARSPPRPGAGRGSRPRRRRR